MSGWGFTGARVEVFCIEGNADGRDRLDYLSPPAGEARAKRAERVVTPGSGLVPFGRR